MIGNKNQFQVLAIISIILYCLGLIWSSVLNPVSRYELSIYEAFPWFFWISLIIFIIIGNFLFIDLVFQNQKSLKKWFIGVTCILFVNIVILLLPIFRGYIIYGRGDVITHVGMIKDILATGYLGSQNMYPFSHVLASQLIILSGIPTNLTTMLIPIFFYIIYFLFTLLLADCIAPSFEAKVLISAFSIILYFTYYSTIFLPTQFSFYFIPMILFLFYRSFQKIKIGIIYACLLIITIISMPFIHPLGTVFLFVTFCIFIIMSVMNNYYIKMKKLGDNNSNILSVNPRKILTFAAIIIISLFIWLSAFRFFRQSVSRIYTIIVLADTGNPDVEIYGTLIQKTGFNIFQLLDIFLKTYYNSIVIVVLSIFSIFLLFQKIRSKKYDNAFNNILFGLLFTCFLFMFIGFSFVDLYLSNPYRELLWALFWGGILIGLIFSDWISTNWKIMERTDIQKKIIPVFLLILLITIGITGIFNTHISPIILRANQQVSNSEFEGMTWFINYRVDEFSTVGIDEFVKRSPEIILRGESPKRNRLGKFIGPTPHFGYSVTSNNVNLLKDSYLVIDSYNTEMYSKLFPKNGAFIASDFEKLENDKLLDKFYSNKYLTIFEISAL